MSRLQMPLIMIATAAAGLTLSYVAYEGTGRDWPWPAVGLGLTAALLAVFAWIQRQMGLVHRDVRTRTAELGSEIARREQSEGVEQQAAERFRALIDSAHDAIIAITPDGRIELFNRAAERIFGYRAVEVVGQNVNILMPQPYRREHDSYLHSYHATGQAKIIGTGREVQAQHKNGTVFPIDLSIGEMRGNGGSRGFIGVIRDITERHQSELRVRELTAELVHISRLSAMGQLSSSLAHELNQPLTAIMNYAEAARQMIETAGSDVPPQVPDFILKAIGQAERAGQIIRRLRSFVEKGPVERSPEDLNRLVIEASNLATIGAKIDGVQVRFDLDRTLEPVQIDKIQIQQVVVNLVRNAVEALRDVEQRELAIRTSAGEDYQEVEIIDSGPGIDPEIAVRLFKPFVSSKKDGMGIGLSISQSIVESHGGRLWADPNPEGGTIFRFRLPLMSDEGGQE
ncbi:nitrogen regulation protein NR(II) [Ferrovibrio sp.]|uniref:two-component system sensor histidine kinase NtrB n=1 Tax=Ferrovibrio sp. TaxID=1917215 RepID=UPI0026100054|nr:PAS domain S-box protein [Ferrovibrio sp.]